MNADLAIVIDDCIERLGRGETLQACLARYPQQADELKACLGAAVRLKKAAQVRPSPEFKARARTRLFAEMAAHPRRLKIPRPRPSLGRRFSFGLAVCLATFAVTTTAMAQFALPGGALYFWKLSSEQAWKMVSPNRPDVDLAIAERRVDEAVAVSGDEQARRIALDEYQKTVHSLAQYTDPAVQERIQALLKAEQDRLKNAGLPAPAPVVRPPQPTQEESTPRVSGGVRNPDVSPTATPVLKLPNVFGP